jgi:hypothetical protein
MPKGGVTLSVKYEFEAMRAASMGESASSFILLPMGFLA